MAQRYETLSRLPEQQYTEGSPVVITAGALLKDNNSGRILAQLKFTSLSSKIIVALKVRILAFDISNVALKGVNEFQYLDLSVKRDDSFGSSKAIPMPEAVTRLIKVECTTVVFADGSSWAEPEDAVWESLPAQLKTEEELNDPELAKQYRIKYGENCVQLPSLEKDLWYCACGALNHGDESKCHKCGKEFFLLDMDALKADRDARLQKEAEEKAAAEEATREKAAADEITRKKFSILAAILIPFIVVALAAGSNLISYSSACRKADSGEFTSASDTLLLRGLTSLYDPNFQYYLRAGADFENKDYSRAADEFNALSGYRNSTEYVQSSQLLQAGDYSEAGDFDKAIDLLKPLYEARVDGAKDALLEALSSKAEKYATDLVYQQTASALAEINAIDNVRYADEKEICESTRYQKAIDYLLSMDINNCVCARILFETLGDYKDAERYSILAGICANHTGNSSIPITDSLIEDLKENIDFANTKDVLLANANIAISFLEGKWSTDNGAYYFNMTIKDDGSANCQFNLPYTDLANSSFAIDNGIYSLEQYDANYNLQNQQKEFCFTIKGPDSISIYCYKDGNTYFLTRK